MCKKHIGFLFKKPMVCAATSCYNIFDRFTVHMRRSYKGERL